MTTETTQGAPVPPGVDRQLLYADIDAALDRSIDRCARCKVCGTQLAAVMEVLEPLLTRLDEAEVALDETAQPHPGAVLPLDREGLRGIVRDVVADFTKRPGPTLRDRITDALWPLLEHAAADERERIAAAVKARATGLDCEAVHALDIARAEGWAAAAGFILEGGCG